MTSGAFLGLLAFFSPQDYFSAYFLFRWYHVVIKKIRLIFTTLLSWEKGTGKLGNWLCSSIKSGVFWAFWRFLWLSR
jgi:hypothetical protein